MRDSNDFNSGFLPDDYVEKKAERRMNVMAITLFILVMFGVTTAFMVTQKNWSGVRADRAVVNQRFIAANDQIAEMDAYELRVEQMVDKAHIAVGLVDTVPRSNLLAEIVLQMPTELSLTRFSLQTTEIKAAKVRPQAVATLGSKRNRGGAAASLEEAETVRPEPRRWKSEVQLDGLAPSLDEVSRFIDALVTVPIFRRVRLDQTQEKEVDDRPMREFRVLFEIDPEADIRENEDPIDMASVDMEEEV
ncbi:MAG: PilN domain-containing protein [Planctomycetota bacterium]|nr:PilN domain-containing protein [Planctomycetota bacterium]MDA1026922.1 PilN domain-containing protein [Planctomycetota bacterium]